MNRRVALLLLCVSAAISVRCQTTIGSPSSAGGVTDQAPGSHLTRQQLIDRDVQRLEKYPPDIQALLDPKIPKADVAAAYRDFRAAGQRLSPLDFLAEAKAIRELPQAQIKDLSGKSAIVALSLGSHGLLPSQAKPADAAVTPNSAKAPESLQEMVKEAKSQLQAAMKSQ